jgi:hypothetical protein
MESIKVDVDGLSALSGVCQREAERLVAGRRDWYEGLNFQATNAAIGRVAATARRAESLISVRLRVTGHKFATGAEWLSEREAASRQQITYSAVVQETSEPGGTPWDGAAATAAAQRVTGDRHAVLDAAGSLSRAGAIARSGATDVRIARQIALDNIHAARSAGFGGWLDEQF